MWTDFSPVQTLQRIVKWFPLYAKYGLLPCLKRINVWAKLGINCGKRTGSADIYVTRQGKGTTVYSIYEPRQSKLLDTDSLEFHFIGLARPQFTWYHKNQYLHNILHLFFFSFYFYSFLRKVLMQMSLAMRKRVLGSFQPGQTHCPAQRMRRLICAFVVRICHKTHFLMAQLKYRPVWYVCQTHLHNKRCRFDSNKVPIPWWATDCNVNVIKHCFIASKFLFLTVKSQDKQIAIRKNN